MGRPSDPCPEYRFIRVRYNDANEWLRASRDQGSYDGHYSRGSTPQEALDYLNTYKPCPSGYVYMLDTRRAPWKE